MSLSLPNNCSIGFKDHDSLELTWGMSSGDTPDEILIQQDNVECCRISPINRSYTVNSLTTGTSYTFKIQSIKNSSNNGGCTVLGTPEYNLYPITDLDLENSENKKMRVSWTKALSGDASFYYYVIHVVAPGINEELHVNNIDQEELIIDVTPCEVAQVTMEVKYYEGVSSSLNKSLKATAEFNYNVTPLSGNFSLTDLKAKMKEVGDFGNLINFSDINNTYYGDYTNLTRAFMPNPTIGNIYKLTDMAGYPTDDPGYVTPVKATVPDNNGELLNAFTSFKVYSNRRWRGNKINVGLTTWKSDGVTSIESATTRTVTAHISEYEVNDNTSEDTRECRLQILYESVPCSGNFDTTLPVIDNIYPQNTYIEIIQGKHDSVAPPTGSMPTALYMLTNASSVHVQAIKQYTAVNITDARAIADDHELSENIADTGPFTIAEVEPLDKILFLAGAGDDGYSIIPDKYTDYGTTDREFVIDDGGTSYPGALKNYILKDNYTFNAQVDNLQQKGRLYVMTENTEDLSNKEIFIPTHVHSPLNEVLNATYNNPTQYKLYLYKNTVTGYSATLATKLPGKFNDKFYVYEVGAVSTKTFTSFTAQDEHGYDPITAGVRWNLIITFDNILSKYNLRAKIEM